MKTNLKVLAVLLAVLTCCGTAMAYETFSNDLIDATRWQDLEFVRMHNAAEGNLSLTARSASSGQLTRSHMRFVDPESIYAIKTEVTITSAAVNQNPNGDATAEVRIQGFFYSTKSNPSGAGGDVWATVRISHDGSGLKADWTVEVIDDDAITTSTPLASGDLVPAGSINLDTTYILELVYAPASSQLLFAIHDATEMTLGSAQYDYTNRIGSPGLPYRAISAIAYNDDAYIDTLIDNVFVSTTDGGAYALYDDFSSFDTANWQDLQFARKIVDGKVALGVQSTENRETNNLRFIDLPDYIQTRVVISSASQIPSGGIGQARINGYFFNDTKPPAQQTGAAGDVWAHILIHDTGNGLIASCYVGKALSDDESQWEDIWVRSFDDFPLVYDTPYTMTLEFTGAAFNFTLADLNQSTTYTYTLPQGTMVYDAFTDFRSLRSRVYGDAGGGTFYATFDNVRTDAMTAGWETISGTVSKDDNPLCAMVLANGQYMFSCEAGDAFGDYQLDVPLDANGEITLQVFVSGLAPYRLTYNTSELDRDVVMQDADPASESPVVTRTIASDASTPNGWVRMTGTVDTQGGTPLCAMVLANGQYMFTCGSSLGTYDLTVPLDGSGNVTHYVFVSGLQPYKQTFTP